MALPSGMVNLTLQCSILIRAQLLQGILKLFGGAEETAPTEDYQEAEEDLVYNSGFSNLKYAAKSQTDYFAAIPDAQAFFVSSFQKLAGHQQVQTK